MSNENSTPLQGSKVREAFIKAQRGFSPALKTSVNPHFRSSYVSLAGSVDAVIDSLHENDIALMQKTHHSDSGVAVETIFIHSSGEELSGGILEIPAVKVSPQDFGSALTYCRRYSLLAACGIAPEDDDGEKAQNNYRDKPKSQERDSKPPMPATKPLPEGSYQEVKIVERAAISNPEANEPPPFITKWQDVVAHLGKTTKGKRLGDIPETVLESMYALYQGKKSFTKEDRILQAALLMWFSGKKGARSELLAKLKNEKIDPEIFGKAMKRAGISQFSNAFDIDDDEADYALKNWGKCMELVKDEMDQLS